MQGKLILMVMGIMVVFIHGQKPREGFCLTPYTDIAGRCYKFNQNQMSWPDAQRRCGREGATLASVVTMDQYNGLLSHINANYGGTYWVSGTVTNGSWGWHGTGGSLNPSWWGGGKAPAANANTCTYLCSNTLRYWPKTCSSSLRFICEKNLLVVDQVQPEQSGRLKQRRQ